MRCPPLNSIRIRVRILFLILVLLPVQYLAAQETTPQACLDGLSEAQNQLFLGDFEQAIAIIQPCLDSNAFENVPDQVRAYELLANVYIAINNEAEARAAIANLLAASPDYQPDPDLSRSDYIFLINEVRSQLPPPPPEITSIDSEGQTITLTWPVDTSIPIASYNLYRGLSADSLALRTNITLVDLPLSPGPNNTELATYVDSSLAYNTRYFYALEAIGENTITSAQSSIVNIPTRPSPEITDLPQAENKRKKLSPWIFIGGGIAAGGLAAVLASGGGNGGDEEPMTETDPGILGGPPGIP